MPDFQKKPTAEAVEQNMQPEQVLPESREAMKPKGAEGEVDTKKKAEQYHQMLDNISKLVHGEGKRMEASEKLMEMMNKHKENPGIALSEATFMVGEAVLNNATQAGVQFTDDLLLAAAMDTIMMLGELAEEAGFFTVGEAEVANAYGRTLVKWMQAHPDMVDWEGINRSLQEADQGTIQAAHEMYGSDMAQSTQEAQQREAGAPRQQPQQPPQQPGGIIGGSM